MSNLTDLTIYLSRPGQTVCQKLKHICAATKDAIPQANRVSLWLFDDSKAEIYCLMCLDENNQFSNAQTLCKRDFPEYFEYILQNKVLNASDARNNAHTMCFNSSYFEPLEIHSLLDFIFHYNFEPTGVICCETVSHQVDWSEEDENALKRVSSITSMFFSEDIKAMWNNKEEIIFNINACPSMQSDDIPE